MEHRLEVFQHALHSLKLKSEMAPSFRPLHFEHLLGDLHVWLFGMVVSIRKRPGSLSTTASSRGSSPRLTSGEDLRSVKHAIEWVISRPAEVRVHFISFQFISYFISFHFTRTYW